MPRDPFRPRPLLFAAALALVVLAAAAAPAAATSYVMVSDADLADQAAVIVEGTVVSIVPSPAGAVPSTDYALAVDGLLKGRTAGPAIVVRVPGGARDDGVVAKVWGAPAFNAGDRALLFLAPHADGSYGILHLLLGAFHLAEVDGETIAARDLAEADEVRASTLGVSHTASPDPAGPRDRERFAAWLADRSRGALRPPDYFAAAASGALANLHATDTATGTVKSYRSTAGKLCGGPQGILLYAPRGSRSTMDEPHRVLWHRHLGPRSRAAEAGTLRRPGAV